MTKGDRQYPDVVVVTQAACVTPSGKEMAMRPRPRRRARLRRHKLQRTTSGPWRLSPWVFPDSVGGVAEPQNSVMAGQASEPESQRSSERLRVTVKAALIKNWMKARDDIRQIEGDFGR